jgi:hypothetical protein
MDTSKFTPFTNVVAYGHVSNWFPFTHVPTIHTLALVFKKKKIKNPFTNVVAYGHVSNWFPFTHVPTIHTLALVFKKKN